MTQAQVARLAASVHAAIHAFMLLLPALVPLIAEHYGVSKLSVDAAGTAHYLAFGFGAIPAGLLADRLGSRRILLACLGGTAASSALAALAPSFAAFAVGIFGVGAFASLYHPAGLSLLSRRTPSESLGRALGVHGIGGNLGEALTPAAAALLAALWSWRLAFAVAAAVSLALLIPVARLRDELPERGPDHPSFLSILSRPLLVVLVASLVVGFVYRGATYFMPRHLTANIDPSQLAWLEDGARWLATGKRGDALGAIVMSLALLTGVVAQYIGGHLADRFRRDGLFVVLATLVAPLILAVGFFQDLPLLAFAILFGFAWYFFQPVLNSIAASMVAPGRHGALFGLMFTSSFGLGAFAVSAGAFAARAFGTSGAYYGLAAVALLNLPLGLLLLRRR